MSPNRAQSPVADAVVSVLEPVTLAGGADFAAYVLNISLSLAPVLVAADGGANRIRAAGLRPDAVIGDLDSISDAARAAFADVTHHDKDQNTTDFEKALTRIDAPFVLAVGFSGARMDHTLAVLNVMARHRDRLVIVLSEDDATFLIPQSPVRIAVPVGTRLSLLPLSDARVQSSGLKWEINDQAMHPTGLISPSNETAQPTVILRAMGPVLVTLPFDHLAAAIAAVRGQ